MKVYLLRHAKAKTSSASDAATGAADSLRPLTESGARKLRRAALGMKRLKLGVDLILTSPYTRAKQTAEIVAAALNKRRKLRVCEHLAANADPARLVADLKRLYPAAQGILLVGHEPYLSRLMSVLITGDMNLSINFKKAGLVLLTTEALKWDRCATLEWFLTPRQLLLVG